MFATIHVKSSTQPLKVFTGYAKPGQDEEFDQFLQSVEENSVAPKIIIGDFNARIGNTNNTISEELNECGRNSKDEIINKRGEKLLLTVQENGWQLINGTTKGDPNGEFTFANHNGFSVVDICITDEGIMDSVSDFCVLSSHLSLHSPIILSLGGTTQNQPQPDKTKYSVIKWDPAKFEEFVLAFEELN